MAPPAPAVRRALAPLLEHPASTAVVTDFDGTISPIVHDPAAVRPLDGAVDALTELAARFGVVAVLSGRRVSFLAERLQPADGHALVARTRGGATPTFGLVGLYGLEWREKDGRVGIDAEAEPWREIVARVVARLTDEAPPGVLVEPKGLTTTVHWRRAPAEEPWAMAATSAEATSTGLVPHHGRMSVELRPPLEVDKGSALRGLVRGCTAACYFGDDLGDLPAFAALSALAADGGMATVSVAVVDSESAPEVGAAADVVLSGPAEAVQALAWLAASAGD